MADNAVEQKTKSKRKGSIEPDNNKKIRRINCYFRTPNDENSGPFIPQNVQNDQNFNLDEATGNNETENSSGVGAETEFRASIEENSHLECDDNSFIPFELSTNNLNIVHDVRDDQNSNREVVTGEDCTDTAHCTEDETENNNGNGSHNDILSSFNGSSTSPNNSLPTYFNCDFETDMEKIFSKDGLLFSCMNKLKKTNSKLLSNEQREKNILQSRLELQNDQLKILINETKSLAGNVELIKSDLDRVKANNVIMNDDIKNLREENKNLREENKILREENKKTYKIIKDLEMRIKELEKGK